VYSYKPLPEAERETYKRFKSEWILEMQDTEITAANAASLSNKLSQLANGAVYDDTGAMTPIHSRKQDALGDLIEAANGKTVLVAYWFKHDLERIQERLRKLNVPIRKSSPPTVSGTGTPEGCKPCVLCKSRSLPCQKPARPSQT